MLPSVSLLTQLLVPQINLMCPFVISENANILHEVRSETKENAQTTFDLLCANDFVLSSYIGRSDIVYI